MKNKMLFSVVTAFILSATLLTGCGSSKSSEGSYAQADMAAGAVAKSSGMDFDNGDYMAEEAYTESYENSTAAESTALSSDTGNGGEAAIANSNRKLIRTVNLSAETLEYEGLMVHIKNKVAELGGYFENLNETKNSYGSQTRYANMTIRVPKERADELITVMENESNITSRDDSTTDVTLDYVDMESHKKSLQVEQKRLLELLEKAETIEDIITLEQRISDVRYEIESMESRLRTYDNKIEYTTVYLSVTEVEEITPTEEPTFAERIREGLKDSTESMAEGFLEITIWFVTSLPYLLLMAVIILILFFAVVRPIIRKSVADGQKRRQEYQEYMLRKTALEHGVPYVSPGDAAAPEAASAGTEAVSAGSVNAGTASAAGAGGASGAENPSKQ